MNSDLQHRRADWVGRETRNAGKLGARSFVIRAAAADIAAQPHGGEPEVITAETYFQRVQRDFAVFAELVAAEVRADDIVDPTHSNDIAASLAALSPGLPAAVAMLIEAGKVDQAEQVTRENLTELRDADPHLFAPDENAMTLAVTQRAVTGGGDLRSLHASADYVGTEGRRRQLWAARHKLQRQGKPIPASAPHVTPITRGPGANAN